MTAAIHPLRESTYTVLLEDGSRVKVRAYDRAGAELQAEVAHGSPSVRVLTGPRDPLGCCQDEEHDAREPPKYNPDELPEHSKTRADLFSRQRRQARLET